MARERFIPFGGNKRTAKRNQALRDVQNLLHDAEKRNGQLLGQVEQLSLELAQLKYPPVRALEKVCSIPTRAAIELQLVDPIVDIHRWMTSHSPVASGKDVARG